METWDSFNGVTEEEKKKKTAAQSGARALKESKQESWDTFNASAKPVQSTQIKVVTPTTSPIAQKSSGMKLLDWADNETSKFLESVKFVKNEAFKNPTISGTYDKAAKAVEGAAKSVSGTYEDVKQKYGNNNGKTFNQLAEEKRAANLDQSKSTVQKSSLSQEEKDNLMSKLTGISEKSKVNFDNPNKDLLDAMNSPAGRKVSSFVAGNSENIPLKAVARVESLANGGKRTYEEVYKAYLQDAENPENGALKNIFYGVQNSGAQSALGVAISISAAALTKNPTAGQAAGMSYFAAISADEQIKSKGKVYSTNNILIDTIGDTYLSKLGERLFRTPKSELGKILVEGGLTEGGTEVSQSFLKMANDYGNAKTEEERESIKGEFVRYVKEGQMAEEFIIGAVVGAGIAGTANLAGNIKGGQPTENVVDMNDISPIINTKDLDDLPVSEMQTRIETLKNELGSETDIDIIEEKSAIISALSDRVDRFVELNRETAVEATGEVLSFKIDTVQYNDSSVGVDYIVIAKGENIAVPFSVNESFVNKEEAIAYAKEEIANWAEAKGLGNEIVSIMDTKQIEKNVSPMSDLEKMQNAVKQEEVKTTKEVRTDRKTSREMMANSEDAQKVIVMNEAMKENNDLKLTKRYKGIKSAILNNAEFKKEGSINYDWIGMPIYKKGEEYRFAKNNEEKMKLTEKGYQYYNSIDGMASEEGIDAEQFLETAIDEIDGGRAVSSKKAAHKFMMENSEEYAKLQERIEQKLAKIKKLKIAYANIEKEIKGESRQENKEVGKRSVGDESKAGRTDKGSEKNQGSETKQ